MNKKILLSISVIAAVAAIAIGGTIAYFDDTETSRGNTFMAGDLDLKIDSTCHYNGMICTLVNDSGVWQAEPGATPADPSMVGTPCGCTWLSKDLGANDVFFNFGDVKPGDHGEDTVSLNVLNNDAWVCAQINNVQSFENGCNSAEINASDTTCGDPGEGQGELQDALKFNIWQDTNCDNVKQEGEPFLAENMTLTDKNWPLFDSVTGNKTPLKAGATSTCIGVAWMLDPKVGNIIQGDSVVNDITFTAIQARSNGSFVCGSSTTSTLPLLTVTKVVMDGPKNVPDFPLFVNGNAVTSGAQNSFSPGTYNITETQQTNYLIDHVSGDCTLNASSTAINPLALANGDVKNCVIYNRDPNAATLIVKKHVINDENGTADANDFTMTVSGVPANKTSFPGDENGTIVGVEAGTYSVDEGAMSGYVKTLGANCTGAIGVGETKTCTITNDDEGGVPTTATLIVKKHVVNDDLGDADAEDFTMTVSAVNPSTSTFPGDEDGTSVTVDPGAYSVNENAMTGYDKTMSIDCSGTINAGETKTCTITNDDVTPVSPMLTVTKIVMDGPKQVSDFVLRVNDDQVTSGQQNSYAPGTYNVTEDPVVNYNIDHYEGDCNASGTVTLNYGDVKNCVIFNKDPSSATLIVKKHVINDEGGTKTAGNFTMTVSGVPANKTSFPGDENGTTVLIEAGSYSINENAMTGYTKTLGANCTGAIGVGETKTCTITNDDEGGTLIVKKIKGTGFGSCGYDDFSFKVDNGSEIRFLSSTSTRTISPIAAGSHSVAEFDKSCGSKTFTPVYGGDCDSSGNVVVGSGETKTCTITNNKVNP